MCGPPEQGCVSQNVLNAVEAQDHRMDPGEVEEQRDGTWAEYWRTYSNIVTCPVMFVQAELDLFFEGSEKQIEEMRKAFHSCERFEGGVVMGAPHAMEWWWGAMGWYSRCFGFAIEVAATEGSKRQQSRNMH